jgi:hypothetical protein
VTAGLGAAADELAVPDVTVNAEVLVEPLPAAGQAQAVDDEVVGPHPDAQAEGEAAAAAARATVSITPE